MSYTMESHEYGIGRTILSPDGEEYLVQDSITAGSGNDWLMVTQDRDLEPSRLVQTGHVKDTWFAVEPAVQEDQSSVGQAQAEAERKRNEKAQKKAQKKAQDKAARKSAAKKAKPAKAAKPTASKPKAKANPTTGPAVPGPAAVSK